MHHARTFALAIALAGAAGRLPAQEDHASAAHAHHESLGTVRFPVQATPEAQRAFERGVTLLHNFHYEEAAVAFREARRADKGLLLAGWMEAFTHSHPLWGQDFVDSARTVLLDMGADPAGRLRAARNARERRWGAAFEAYFADAPDSVRFLGFADSTRHLASAYPKDLEAQAFAALGVMIEGYRSGEPDDALLDEAARYADAVLRAQPHHPGAAHYLIHIYDSPARAAKGLAAARAYASIAPDATHALHMPSHIFLQLGLWDDVAASNERSWASARAAGLRHGDADQGLEPHCLYWLQYAYLEQGRWREARALVDTARAIVARMPESEIGDADIRYIEGDLAFAWAMATGNWNDPLVAVAVKPVPADRGASTPRAQGMRLVARFQAGWAAARRGDSATVAEALAYFEGAEGNPALANLLRLALAGAGDDRAKQLADLERQVRSATGSPVGPPYLPPGSEVLGAALLADGRAAEALKAYERALALRPNRSDALLGVMRAARAAGDAARADEARRALDANWRRADPEVRTRLEVATR